MKQAVITTGGRQYLVAEGDELTVNLLKHDKKTVSFEPLMIVDGKNSKVGTPIVKDAKVNASIISADEKADKVVSIRHKSKKRVKKIRGHRQRQTTIKITKIV